MSLGVVRRYGARTWRSAPRPAIKRLRCFSNLNLCARSVSSRESTIANFSKSLAVGASVVAQTWISFGASGGAFAQGGHKMVSALEFKASAKVRPNGLVGRDETLPIRCRCPLLLLQMPFDAQI